VRILTDARNAPLAKRQQY